MKTKAGALKGATYPITISTPFGVLRYVYTVDSRSVDFVPGVGIAAGHDCGAAGRCLCEHCSGRAVSA